MRVLQLDMDARESRIFLWSALALLFASFGFIVLKNATDTLFLKRVGVEFLPTVFLVNSLVLAGTMAVVGRFAARKDPLRLVTWVFISLSVAFLVLFALVVLEVPHSLFVLILAAKQIESVGLLVFWLAMGFLLHARQAKRLYAPLTAGATLGSIAGSFASEPLGELFGIPGLLPLAGLALLAGACATLPLRRLRPARIEVGLPAPAASLSRADEASRVSFRALWRRSWLLRALVASASLAGVLSPMLYFLFSYVADQATTGAGAEEQLLGLYAHIRGWLFFAVLLVQLVGAPRVFRRLGIPLALSLSPLLALVGFAGLSIQLSLVAGVFALTTSKVQDNAIYDPGQRILLNLFPGPERARVMAWVEGPVKRLAGALGNLIVLGALWLGSALFVGYVSLPLAAIWLCVAVVLWRAYPALLLQTSARQGQDEDPDALAEVLESATPRLLSRQLLEPDPGRCRAGIALVCEARRSVAIPALAHAVARAPEANVPALLEALARLLEDGPELGASAGQALQELLPLLDHCDALPPLARAHLLQATGRLSVGPGAPETVHSSLRPFLSDASPAVRLAAAAALQRLQPGPVPAPDLALELGAAVRGDSADARHVACGELHSLLLQAPKPDDASAWRAGIAQLVTLLEQPGDRARAANALWALARRHGTDLKEFVPALLAHRQDLDPEVRAAVLGFLGHAGASDQIAAIAEGAASLSRVEANAAREALRTLGPDCLASMLRELSYGRRSVGDALIPIVREFDVPKDSLRSLLEQELETLQSVTVRLWGLTRASAPAIVLQRLSERIVEGVHTTFLLLAALQGDDQLADLGSRLRRAGNPRETALLLEAADALLTPQDSQRLLPLLEDRPLSWRARVAADALGRTLPDPRSALREALEDPDEITRSLLASSLAMHEADATLEADGMLSDVEIVLQLRTAPLFDRLTTRQLWDLGGVVQQQIVEAGAVLVREGDYGDEMYLIVEGRVRITKADALLRELGPGEYFGEIALVDGAVRSASAVADERVHLLRITRQDLLRRMEELPGIAIAICQTLSQRVRELEEPVHAEAP